MLESLENGIAPLAVHVGMAQGSNQQVNFDVGGQLSVTQLAAQSIFTRPSPTQQCGVLNNPFFVDKRLESGAVQFGSCETSRPFICTRSFSSEAIAGKILLVL